MSETTLTGRETAPLVRIMLVLTGGAAGFIGLILFLGSSITDDNFAWPLTSPVTSVILGAGFVGAVPLLWWSATKILWEQLRVCMAASTILTVLLSAITLADLGHTSASGGDLVPYLLALAWVIGVTLLALGNLLALVVQFREPALPLPRTAPIPRWAVALVSLEGSGLLIVGGALLIEPNFWRGLLPWQVGAFDARMLGAWGVTLGVTLLIALIEDDLLRVKPGLLGAAGIGALGLVGLAWRSADITWGNWASTLTVVLIGGLFATGAIGWRLARVPTKV
ncbi:MAG: hypothetical protein ACSLEW_13035 [Nocardioides sp.]